MPATTSRAGRHPTPEATHSQRPGVRTAKPDRTCRHRRKAAASRTRLRQPTGRQRTGVTRFISQARQPWQPGPSWPDHPAIHRTPQAAAAEPGIEPGR